MREVPQRDGAGGLCPSSLAGDIGHRRGAVVDDGSDHHGNVVEPIEVTTNLQPAGTGDPVDHVAIRREVGRS